MSDARDVRHRAPERAATASLLAATLASLLLVARNGLEPGQAPLSFGLVFWFWQAALFLAAGALLLVALTLVGRACGRPGLGALLAPATAVFALGTTWLGNADAGVSLLSGLEGPASFRWLVGAAFVLCHAGLAAAALPASRLLRRGIATAAVLSAALALWPTPRPGDPPEPAPEPSRPACAPNGAERVLLVGLDGADWAHIDPLMARGELPNLAALRARAAWGQLRTLEPTRSPSIWNTVVTGVSPERHGIVSHAQLRVVGVDDPLPPIEPTRGFGFDWLFETLRRRGLVRYGPLLSTQRRVPAFWNIASDAGLPVDVVSWRASWPAERILGRMVSERIHWQDAAAPLPEGASYLTHPESLARSLAPLVVRPAQVDAALLRTFSPLASAGLARAPDVRGLLAMFETDRRVALELVERGREECGAAPDLLVLLRIVDLACHAYLDESELVEDHAAATPEARTLFGRVVTDAYRAADRMLGELVPSFGAGQVIVLSDHGWNGTPDDISYTHEGGPPGIFLAAGPAFRGGAAGEISVYDVLPLLLYLKGLPLADDLEGRLPRAIVADDFAASRPQRRIASYGRRRVELATRPAPDVDARMIEELRALGYLR